MDKGCSKQTVTKKVCNLLIEISCFKIFSVAVIDAEIGVGSSENDEARNMIPLAKFIQWGVKRSGQS